MTTDHKTLQRDALQAVQSLRGPALQKIVEYLDAHATEVAVGAMSSSSVSEVRKKQGEHRALVKVVDLLRAERSESKRTQMRSVA